LTASEPARGMTLVGSAKPDEELYRGPSLSGSSCSASFVTVMQFPNLGHGYHWSQLWSLDRPRLCASR
jgi:hypothetical protein